MMSDQPADLFAQNRRSNWVRLRTLVVLRWLSVAGQVTAINVAQRLFDLELDLGLAYMAVGASVIANVVALFIYPESKRLNETEVAGMLLFDIVQLSFLLALTGGLNNPFALLLLVPVTISATALQARSTMMLGGIAIALVTLVGLWHVPLQTTGGEVMRMPPVFVVGFWTAIVIGVAFLASFAQRVTAEMHAMADALLATQMALTREQKLTDLGGVVAATAHELGTPLATIKLVSSELIEDLEGEAREDAVLIRDQADRCRDILQSMGRIGKEDLHLRQAPLAAVLREAAEPHAARGRTILYEVRPEPGADPRQPLILRRPEIVHGLRNLVQNAVDFAASTVWIDATWTDREVTVRIADDGPGYPVSVLSRIGDPFVRRRRAEEDRLKRPEYEGMGLGLFIAKTLLERTGAELSFVNGRDVAQPSAVSDRGGAIVVAVWPRAAISPELPGTRPALGQNRPIEA